MFRKKNIYLDHAGATPINKKVLKIMAFYERGFFANPSALYQDGVNVRNAINESKKKIASLINARSDEIIFTGSGTESDSLAILGTVRNYELLIKNKKQEYKIPHIITTKIEHPAVIENFRLLEENREVEVTYLSVNSNGIINLEELKDSLKENTILVSVMYANNEIGTIQPIEEVAKIIRHFKKKKVESEKEHYLKNLYPLFHTDACQAMNYLFTENVEKLGIDLMSFNGSKIYGPKGIGILYKKRGLDLVPLYGGGGQEFGLRSGTENIALIMGVTEALIITNKIKEKECARLIKIRDYAIKKLLLLSETSGFKIILNGHKENRLPNNINISIYGISGELLVIELGSKGVFLSSKSACKSAEEGGSYVIRAIRKVCKKNEVEEGSLRITLGRETNKREIDIFIYILSKILNKYKNLL